MANAGARSQDSAGRWLVIVGLSCCSLHAVGFPRYGLAQSPLTSSGLNTRITQSPINHAQYDITGGTRPGNGPNLFHSFGTFDVPSNQIANFLNESGLATSNILGRVTGGNPSNIFGTIQTTGFGKANLFLMNPAGIVFGPNATLNVGGSVAFTTADYLRLADGTRFTAIPGQQDAAISTAPVAAFGFLGSNPAAITVQGTRLAVAEGQSLSLVGGNIDVAAGTLADGTGQSARLSAPSGQVALISLASAGETSSNTTADRNVDAAASGIVAFGDISLSQRSTIDTSADKGGRIVIRAGQFTMEDSTLTAFSQAAQMMNGGEASAISITAEHAALHNGTYVSADTFGPAPAGTITFNVRRLTTDGGPIRLQVTPESRISDPMLSQTGVLIESTSRSVAATAGQAGHIVIRGWGGSGHLAETVSLDDTILHTRSFGGTADTFPGGISIAADTVSLRGQVEIYSTANGDAPAGHVDLHVNQLFSNMNPDGSFIVGRPVFIGSPTEKPDRTAGPPGAVTISGPGPETTDPAKLVMLSNTEIDTFAVGGSSPIPAPIVMTAETLSLNNLTILVTTSGGAAPAPAGDIVLNVDTLRINVDEKGLPITDAARVYLNSPSGRLDATAGPPGTVTISGLGPEPTDAAKSVALYNTQMSTAVEGGSSDLSPGSITITADTMTMSGTTQIFAFTTSPAPAGNIALNVNELRSNVNADGSLIDGGRFGSLLASVSVGEDTSAGRAGTVTISGVRPEATDPARLIALNNTEVSTNVFGGTAATSPASITMAAETIRLTNSPKIQTDTHAAAPAGHIRFHANTLSADHGTTISSSTSGSGTGGSIIVSTGKSVTLDDHSSITASSTGTGNAGNITINAGARLLSSNSSVTTQATQASGGNITLQATDAIRLVNSQINTSVQGGPLTAGGNIMIDPAVLTLQNSQILAQAVQGQGGNINISAGTFLTDQTSVVSASSQFGLSGTVNIQSPVSNLSGTLATLSQRPLQAHNLLRQRCAAQVNGELSSFVAAGRDTLPAQPGRWLMSPLALLTDQRSVPSSTQAESSPLISILEGRLRSRSVVDRLESASQRGLTEWVAGCGG